ncbi:uncharacterized protein BDR25DRAFT_353440 [Lindgomyces ingoldianus]|uniref:Uncharacterized protein n=1 Tax=Lindgomyces ingoldianus TaxID=673940 RepID=A0ACB6QZF3_9PLEO|nr:uncharacterized protein BDR25DRAFT_353440 [Lindgomyces ingoldianus]KAF2472413.1 hypothetical protein BDR25DRAFT_353440 [Lindgomyces ingoldianus]
MLNHRSLRESFVTFSKRLDNGVSTFAFFINSARWNAVQRIGWCQYSVIDRHIGWTLYFLLPFPKSCVLSFSGKSRMPMFHESRLQFSFSIQLINLCSLNHSTESIPLPWLTQNMPTLLPRVRGTVGQSPYLLMLQHTFPGIMSGHTLPPSYSADQLPAQRLAYFSLITNWREVYAAPRPAIACRINHLGYGKALEPAKACPIGDPLTGPYTRAYISQSIISSPTPSASFRQPVAADWTGYACTPLDKMRHKMARSDVRQSVSEWHNTAVDLQADAPVRHAAQVCLTLGKGNKDCPEPMPLHQ